MIFGAAALAPQTQAKADQTLELLLRYGINHIDVAASYGDAELRLAPWMAQYRSQFFLATKTGQRTAQAARGSYTARWNGCRWITWISGNSTA